MTKNKLVELAQKVRENSYSPYSKFRVGAVVLAENDKVYTGVNVENSSFGATICAERSAILSAISDGQRKIKIIAIASDQEDYIYPCGMCRQVIAEFADENTKILCSNSEGKYKEYSSEDIFPNSFHLIEKI